MEPPYWDDDQPVVGFFFDSTGKVIEVVEILEEKREDVIDRRLRERRRNREALREASRDDPTSATKPDVQTRREGRIARRDRMDLEVFNAVKDDNPKKLDELINSGANVNTVYKDYSKISTKSLIHVCCEKGRMECARIVMNHGAFLNIRDKWGQTPLMYCMITQYHEIAEMLLMKQPNLVLDEDHFGKSPLHCAAESGCVQSVNVLLKYGADVCVCDCYGVTPMMAGVSQTERSEDAGPVVQLMVDAGYRLEMKDLRCKRTALQMAVRAKNLPAVEVLLAAGADVNTVDGGKRTPLTNAIQKMARKPPGGGACVMDPDGMVIIVMLTQYKSNLNMAVHDNANPLVVCALVDAAEPAQYLLDNGADPNIICEPSGATPLIIATKKNSIAVVRVLLLWNCRTDQKGLIRRCETEYNMDALELAIFLGHLEIARLLVLAGCSLQTVTCLKRFTGDGIPLKSMQEHPEFLEWLQDLANNPVSLTQTCLLLIRKILGYGYVDNKVLELPVPPRVRDMITLAYCLNYSDVYNLT